MAKETFTDLFFKSIMLGKRFHINELEFADDLILSNLLMFPTFIFCSTDENRELINHN